MAGCIRRQVVSRIADLDHQAAGSLDCFQGIAQGCCPGFELRSRSKAQQNLLKTPWTHSPWRFSMTSVFFCHFSTGFHHLYGNDLFCESPFLFHFLKSTSKFVIQPFSTKSKRKLRREARKKLGFAVPTSFALSTVNTHTGDRGKLFRNIRAPRELCSCDVIDFTIVCNTRSRAHCECDEWNMPRFLIGIEYDALLDLFDDSVDNVSAEKKNTKVNSIK